MHSIRIDRSRLSPNSQPWSIRRFRRQVFRSSAYCDRGFRNPFRSGGNWITSVQKCKNGAYLDRLPADISRKVVRSNEKRFVTGDCYSILYTHYLKMRSYENVKGKCIDCFIRADFRWFMPNPMFTLTGERRLGSGLFEISTCIRHDIRKVFDLGYAESMGALNESIIFSVRSLEKLTDRSACSPRHWRRGLPWLERSSSRFLKTVNRGCCKLYAFFCCIKSFFSMISSHVFTVARVCKTLFAIYCVLVNC